MFLRMNVVAFHLERDARFYRGLVLEWLAVLFNQLLRCKQRQHGITEEISTCKHCKTQCFLGEKCKFQVNENEKQTNMRMGKGNGTFRSGALHPGI